MPSLSEALADQNRLTSFLTALRKALIQIAAVVFGFSLFGYVLAKSILTYLQRHTGVTLAYYGLAETFFSLLNIALAVGLAISVPFIIYKVLAAIQPLFETFSRRAMLGFFVVSIFLFYLGASFCLFVTLPYGTQFLLSYQGPNIEAIISVKKFISFCLLLVFGFGIIFELPLVMVLLGRIGLVKKEVFSHYRRYAFLAIAVLSAILTPTPDAINMALMAAPLYILYEVGILGMRLWGNGKKQG